MGFAFGKSDWRRIVSHGHGLSKILFRSEDGSLNGCFSALTTRKRISSCTTLLQDKFHAKIVEKYLKVMLIVVCNIP